jgi:Sec7-like guanine-nucleotide exchange factor
MKLDENYRIETDTNNFTLVYESKKFDEVKKKEFTSKDEWHYPELKYALIKYLNQSLKPCKSIKDVLSKISELEQLIKNTK